MGSNVFQMGPNVGGGVGACYVNGGGSPLSDQLCPNIPGAGKMGVYKPGRWERTGRSWCYEHSRSAVRWSAPSRP